MAVRRRRLPRGQGGRPRDAVNTVLQTCFFALAGVMPVEDAIAAIKDAIVKTYGRLGETVITRNFAAVDSALEALHEVAVPRAVGEGPSMVPAVPATSPTATQHVAR